MLSAFALKIDALDLDFQMSLCHSFWVKVSKPAPSVYGPTVVRAGGGGKSLLFGPLADACRNSLRPHIDSKLYCHGDIGRYA